MLLKEKLVRSGPYSHIKKNNCNVIVGDGFLYKSNVFFRQLGLSLQSNIEEEMSNLCDF